MIESIRKLQTSSLAVQNYHATFIDGGKGVFHFHHTKILLHSNINVSVNLPVLHPQEIE